MSAYGAQSTHNKNACDFLGAARSEYVDWQITMLFYSALHLTNQYFEFRGIPIPDRHNQRLESVRRELPDIIEAYKNLKVLSEQSRYEGRGRVDDISLASALKSHSEIADRLARSAGRV